MSREIYCRSCGCLMKERSGKFGKFYGCTGYPICKETLRMRDVELQPESEDRDKLKDRWDQ